MYIYGVLCSSKYVLTKYTGFNMIFLLYQLKDVYLLIWRKTEARSCIKCHCVCLS